MSSLSFLASLGETPSSSSVPEFRESFKMSSSSVFIFCCSLRLAFVLVKHKLSQIRKCISLSLPLSLRDGVFHSFRADLRFRTIHKILPSTEFEAQKLQNIRSGFPSLAGCQIDTERISFPAVTDPTELFTILEPRVLSNNKKVIGQRILRL